MDRKAILMKRLQICEFVLTEVGLFLDTHPDNKDALEHYNKYLEKRNETLDEYTKQFGTVDRTRLHDQARWDWVDNPWPWETEV